MEYVWLAIIRIRSWHWFVRQTGFVSVLARAIDLYGGLRGSCTDHLRQNNKAFDV